MIALLYREYRGKQRYNGTRHKVLFYGLLSALCIPFLVQAQIITPSEISRVSENVVNGEPASAGVVSADMDGSSNLVVFSSGATNLNPLLDGVYNQVFLKDISLGTLTLISQFQGELIGRGDNDSVAISRSGSHIVFQTNPKENSDPFQGCEILRYTISLSSLDCVSTDSSGVPIVNFDVARQAQRESRLSISPDGRYVAFSSKKPLLASLDTNNKFDVYLKDMVTGTLSLISSDSNGTVGNANSYIYSRSMAYYDNDIFVVFESGASLSVDDSNSHRDIYLKKVGSGETFLVSKGLNGLAGNAQSIFPSISSTNRKIVFQSDATNLVSGDTNAKTDIFVSDAHNFNIERVSETLEGEQGQGLSIEPSISVDGTLVAFSSNAINFPLSASQTFQIYVKSLVDGGLGYLSTNMSGEPGNLPSVPPILNNQQDALFFSQATNLLGGSEPPSGLWQIYKTKAQSTPVPVQVKEAIFEDFKSGWNGWSHYFTGNTEGYPLSDSSGAGTLSLFHDPTSMGVHSINYEKEFSFEFKPNTWFHTRFRKVEPLIGVDMYTDVLVDNKIVFRLGIDGEQHWQDLVAGQECIARSNDVSFKTSMPRAIGYTPCDNAPPAFCNEDHSVGIPAENQPYSFTDWVVLSMKYEVDSSGERYRVFVNGREINYLDLTALKAINNSVNSSASPITPNPTTGKNDVTIRMGQMLSGDAYNHNIVPNDDYPHCHTPATGAIPISTVHSPLGLQAKLSWMDDYDAVINNMSDLWGAISAGTVQYDVAVLMGALPWDPNNWVWNYMPPSRKQFVEDQINAGYIPSPDNYSILMVVTHGQAYISAQHGYLSKAELQNSWIWSYLSPSEKDSMPDVKTSEFQWDYVILASDQDVSILEADIVSLIFEGRLDASSAVSLSLLTWQQVEFACPYMACSEISHIRSLAAPQGSPNFCSSRTC